MSIKTQESTPILQLRLKGRHSSLVELKPQLSQRGTLSSSIDFLQSERNSSKTTLPLPPLTLRGRNSTRLKVFVKKFGAIKGFAVGTNQGMIRNYNEDRMTIMPKLYYSEKLGNLAFFGIFDGHGGAGCADFLADNLHRVLAMKLAKENSVKDAIKSSFELVENNFVVNSYQKNFDKSGSCAICAVVSEKYLFIANVGDSRCILSASRGKKLVQISEDHKPGIESEKIRIEKAGGIIAPGNNLGVARVLPGNLSVSRTFGDISAKLKQLGGNPNVVVADPDIYRVKLKTNFDYVLLASDGIFDVLSNEEVNQAVWQGLSVPGDLNSRLTNATNCVIDLSLQRRSSDNVSCIIISLSDNEFN